MGKPVTFASPDNNNEVAQAYERHVKRCVAGGHEPLTPERWLEVVQVVEGFRSAAEFQRPTPAPDPEDSAVRALSYEDKAKAHEDEIRAKFTEIAIIEGFVKELSLMERVRHRLALGDERPMTVKQTQPCEMCGDILCRWAK